MYLFRISCLVDWKPADPQNPTKNNKKKYDRYIPSRSNSSSQDHTGPILPPSSTSNPSTATLDGPDPEHTSDLSQSLGLDPNKRILSFFSEPPPSQTEHSALLASYARLPSQSGSSSSNSAAVAAASRRRIAMRPERILDSPGMVDDYYLNLLDWSSSNLVAIGLGESVYVWNASTGSVDLLCSVGGEGDASSEGDEYICSVKFTEDGSFLAVGLSSGPIQIYDVVTATRVRTMAGHLSRVPSLSWSGAILSSGCRTGAIWNSDVRVAQHKTAEMLGHRGEVCGLAWRPEPTGGLSGGGQGVRYACFLLLGIIGVGVLIGLFGDLASCKWWKRQRRQRLGRSNDDDSQNDENESHCCRQGSLSFPFHFISRLACQDLLNFRSLQAVAWCPWMPSLLATGGGSTDRTIHFWNTTTSARLHSLVTPSQVTSLIFNPHSREILSSHGIPDHQLSIWAYPSLGKVTDIPQAHEARILHSCLSPDGTTVATASSDENLKFWKVFEGRTVTSGAGRGAPMGQKDVEEDHGIGNRKTKTGINVR